MAKLEMFFDYSCPYCKIGYEILLSVMEKQPDIEVEWFPCEAHPRPEEWGYHSDLAAAGMYVARDLGADLAEYHRIMYKTATDKNFNIEDVEILKNAVADILDAEAFAAALNKGKYLDKVKENNQLTWGTYEFPAVPSFKRGDELLPAIPGVGVTKDSLAEFCD